MRELIFPHITNGNEVYMDVLNLLLGDTPRNSFLDLGCNLAPNTPLLNFKKRKYIDILPRLLDIEEERQYFEQADILKTKTDKYYNVSFSLDVIEHLTINDGFGLIHIMKEVSDKQILFTPLDDIFGMDYETNNPESHRSLWKPEMIEAILPHEFIFLTFPQYHSIWNGGAFFMMSCKGDIDKEFERISIEINQFSWAKL